MAAYVCPADPIAFDAPDGQPVKDIIVLLVPEWGNSMHLHLLADVAQRFCDHHFREQLSRGARMCGRSRAVSRLSGTRAGTGEATPRRHRDPRAQLSLNASCRRKRRSLRGHCTARRQAYAPFPAADARGFRNVSSTRCRLERLFAAVRELFISASMRCASVRRRGAGVYDHDPHAGRVGT